MRIPLKSLKFLALDCQTTGNNPSLNHLLEIGWIKLDAGDNWKAQSLKPTTLVVRQPDGEPLPIRIQKLTGIDNSHIQDAVPVSRALDALLKAVECVAQENRMTSCPTIIHYARFEMGFLTRLFRKFSQSAEGGLDVICTHQIAARLMPFLPRKGIRALSGYLGHSMPALKRCSGHLKATAHIWRCLLDRLADQADVHTLDELHHWLSQPPAPATPKTYPMPGDRRLGIPDQPGIYRMMRSNGDLLYIGKATSLKKRINSYFHKRRHSESNLEMLTQAADLEYTTTATALEAALLESDLIKQYEPPYNKALTNKGRKLFYISPDFANHLQFHRHDCPLGPVPAIDSFLAISHLETYLKTRLKSELNIPVMMATTSEYCPDEATFLTGLELFQSKYLSVYNRLNFCRAALHIGRRSWRQKMANAHTSKDTDEDSAPSDNAEPFEWTPDGVAKFLESICRRCGFLLRRARWFAIISRSTLAWRNKTDPDQLNMLLFEGGRIEGRIHANSGASLPKPTFDGRRHINGTAGMDLLTYDRLRVLTTELRRLLSENRFQTIRLSPKVYLHSQQLEILLNWI